MNNSDGSADDTSARRYEAEIAALKAENQALREELAKYQKTSRTAEEPESTLRPKARFGKPNPFGRGDTASA